MMHPLRLYPLSVFQLSDASLKKNAKTYFIQICINDSYLPNVLQLRVALNTI